LSVLHLDRVSGRAHRDEVVVHHFKQPQSPRPAGGQALIPPLGISMKHVSDFVKQMSLSAESVRLDNHLIQAPPSPLACALHIAHVLCVAYASPLQKNELKALISLARAQNRTHGKTVLSAHAPALPNGADCRQAPARPRPKKSA
jgi:hypothetical protein